MGLFSYSTDFTFNAPIKVLFRAVQEAIESIKIIESSETFENQNIIIAMTKFNMFRSYGQKIEIRFQAVDKLNTKVLISSSVPILTFRYDKEACNNIIYETKRVLLLDKYRELIENDKVTISKNSVSQDPYGELIKLKKLLDAGIISEIDFESKKQDLLSQLQ
ncbi:MAG: SHOCT domain-containing protein [Ignavibacteriales bacterium]|mgnify:CR=1 FL=1|nr:SHOCT domain-containing protein [Ignavibacteriota bacterium]MCO6448922.1 SHOCT domain-containing protein [Ignavibacterium album]MCZ2267827.1 SHOCT domain-containing protein [Ignavibacteriales bacterium]HOJ07788.1 SHOCT domain-containing protein [Ignavibacteriaceae bacterium]